VLRKIFLLPTKRAAAIRYATRVAGFWTWKNLGRSVNAGAKDLRILAPMVGVRRQKDEEAEKDITKQDERILLDFRNAYVVERLSRDLRSRLYSLDATRGRMLRVYLR
jgi:hypothetical protein